MVTATMGAHGYEPSLAAVSTDGGEGLLAAFDRVKAVRYAYLTMAVNSEALGLVASAVQGDTLRFSFESRRADEGLRRQLTQRTS